MLFFKLLIIQISNLLNLKNDSDFFRIQIFFVIRFSNLKNEFKFINRTNPKYTLNTLNQVRELFIRKCAKLSLSVVGIWGTLITYGVFQERIIKQPYKNYSNDSTLLGTFSWVPCDQPHENGSVVTADYDIGNNYTTTSCQQETVILFTTG